MVQQNKYRDAELGRRTGQHGQLENCRGCVIPGRGQATVLAEDKDEAGGKNSARRQYLLMDLSVIHHQNR